MIILLWLGVAWLLAAASVTITFLSARRSPLVYRWLFGDKTVARATAPAHTGTSASGARLVA